MTVGAGMAPEAQRRWVGAGQMTLLPDPTIAELVGLYLSDLAGQVRRGERSRHTISVYERNFRFGAMAWFHDRRVSTLTTREIAQMHEALGDERGVSAANQALARLSGLIDYGMRIGRVVDGANPARRVRLFPARNRCRPLEPQHAQAALDLSWRAFTEPGLHVISPVLGAYFVLMLATGMRRSEATHLRRDEWDSARRLITITRDKAVRHRKAHEPKVLPANDEAAKILDAIVERDWHPVWFFPSRRASRGHLEDPGKAWKKVLAAIGAPADTRLHDVRHGFAVAAFEAEKDSLLVSSLLGHLDPRTTHRYIGRLKPKTVAPVSQKAADIFLGLGKKKDGGSDDA